MKSPQPSLLFNPYSGSGQAVVKLKTFLRSEAAKEFGVNDWEMFSPDTELEPDIQEQATDEPLDDAMPDDMPDALAGDDLGIDGEGVAGGDGFGLVARKGGRGLLGGGNGYTAIIQSQITDMLADDDALRFLDYTVVLQIWVAKTGSIERFNFTSFSGDEQTKKRLKNLLASLDPFESGPPIEMPQPIKLRIRSQL